MAISRKTFLVVLAGGGASWLATACGGSDDAGTPDGPGFIAAGSCGATIESNHGHSFAMASADLDATTNQVVDITGTADHGHTVTLTLAQMAQLKAGQSVTVSSTVQDGHSHSLTIRCA